MIVTILVRRLREGRTFEEFKQAWQASDGYMTGFFGHSITVRHARRLDDPREILSYVTMDVPIDQLQGIFERMAAGERQRHDRIAEIIEETRISGTYEVIDETELS
jgi:hypothetical protein